MDFMTRIKLNFLRYLTIEIPSAIIPALEIDYKSDPDWINGAICILLISLCIMGIRQLPKFKSLIIGYLGGSFMILMFWPNVWIGIRFMLPLTPILVILVAFGLTHLLQLSLQVFKIKSNYTAFLLLPFLLLNFQEFTTDENPYGGSYPMGRLSMEAKGSYAPSWQNYFKIADYAKKNLKDTDIIACRKPQLFHIKSDRFTTLYPYLTDHQEAIKTLEDKNISYVVVDALGYSSTSKYLVPLIQNNPYMFRQVLHLENPDTYLFQFLLTR